MILLTSVSVAFGCSEASGPHSKDGSHLAGPNGKNVQAAIQHQHKTPGYDSLLDRKQPKGAICPRGRVQDAVDGHDCLDVPVMRCAPVITSQLSDHFCMMQRQCGICLEDVLVGDMQLLTACSHSYCKDCLRTYMATQARDRIYPFRCMCISSKLQLSSYVLFSESS